VFGPGGAFDFQCEFLRGTELVHVTAATSEPAIQFVRNGCGVRNPNVKSATRFEDTAYFFERIRQALNVFEAVVGDHYVEATGAERELRGIALDEVGRGRRRALEVKTDYGELAGVGIEAASRAAEIEGKRSRRQGAQELMHGIVSMIQERVRDTDVTALARR
jgi:hypothetical protein